MLNRTVLVGRLTKDPELRYTQQGTAVTNFTLAVNRPFKSQDGEQQADFIQIQVWRKAAESAANYLSKGSLCGVDGRIQTRNYEGQDGKRVYVTEVIADQVQFLDSKKDSQQNNARNQNTGYSNQGYTNTSNNYQNTNGGQYAPNNSTQNQMNNDPFSGGEQINISSDDLPF